MLRKSAVVRVLVATLTGVGFAQKGRAGATGVLFVTSQGLYYDTLVTNDPLPKHASNCWSTARPSSAPATRAISAVVGGKN